MKRIVLLTIFLASVALCAGAQTYVDFSQMPIAHKPAVMPDSYPEASGMYWNNFYYVTPGLWSGAGAGFWVDPATQHNSVAFIGGPLCTLATPCNGSIKTNSIMTAPFNRTFTPVSISVSAGWFPNRVTVTAYNNGKFVGSLVWNLATKPLTFAFPPTWKEVTQLVFIPDVPLSRAVHPTAGSMVVYSFIYMAH